MEYAGILAPLVVCILAGLVMGRWRNLRPEPFVAAVMDLFMPALVFDALLTAPVSLSEMYVSGLSSAAVICLLLLLCLAARRVFACPLRSFALPVLFMNAGFLGMPLMDMAFGPAALGLIVIYDQVQSFFMFSLGIWIASSTGESSGRQVFAESLRAFLKEPLIYAILIAVGFRIGHVIVPEPILNPIRFLGTATSPLALFALGLRLAATPIRFLTDAAILRRLAMILALRFGGGLACGVAVVAILSLEDLTRQVVLVASALPAAVFSYILAERYNADPDLAAAAVFVSTLASLPFLPLLLRLTA